MAELFTEIKIGKNKFKNRIFMSPMCMYNCFKEDGILTKEQFDHYTARALGGVGAIVIEAAMVNSEAGITKRDLGLYNDSQVNELRKLVNSIHHYDCKVGIQLSHAGRKATDYEVIYAPSPIPYSEDSKIPKELTKEEIEKLVDDFSKAAVNAEKANFDFIEIHVAHGYLLSQFISPISNRRIDEYGGSLENRYKIVGDIIKRIKLNTDLDIHLRISADEVEKNGNSLEDIAKVLIWAKEDGVVLNDISSGGITPTPPKRIYPGYQAEIAKILKEYDLTIGAVGVLDDSSLCEYLVSSGEVDVVYIGRALLRNPFWAMQAAKDLHERYEPRLTSYRRGFLFKTSHGNKK